MASVNEFLGQHENRKQLFGKFATNDVAREFSRQDKTRQDKTRQDKTRQDKTRQDKTRQDKTRQDNTRPDKTFIIKISPVQILCTQLAEKRW